MSRPGFWDGASAGDRLARAALTPLSALYALGGAVRGRLIRPAAVDAQVICVGAASVGGSGKTPVAIALAKALKDADRNPALLARGHGGARAGPLRVDLDRHGPSDVGDEALLLARAAPAYVARRRDRAARLAAGAGHDALVMDDGLTHPWLRPDRALLTLDGAERPDRALILPAGPLRESWARTAARADAALILGDGPARTVLDTTYPSDRRFQGRLEPAAPPPEGPLVAFAGLGRPEKFFRSLASAGGDIIATRAFPDHHAYTERDLDRLRAAARRLDARLVTTEKDAVKLPPAFLETVRIFSVRAVIDGLDRLLALLTAPR